MCPFLSSRDDTARIPWPTWRFSARSGVYGVAIAPRVSQLFLDGCHLCQQLGGMRVPRQPLLEGWQCRPRLTEAHERSSEPVVVDGARGRQADGGPVFGERRVAVALRHRQVVLGQ